jgi:hypothetical protein
MGAGEVSGSWTHVDHPVGPFSPVEEIRAWLDELKAMRPMDDGVKASITVVSDWLELAENGGGRAET